MKTLARTGIIQIILSGVCFGFLGIFGKFAYEKGVTPGELLSLRFLLGGGLTFLIPLYSRKYSVRLGLKPILACFGLGVFGYAVFSSCYFNALQGLSASLTVLLLYTYPLIVSAGAWILFGERIPKSRWAALPLVMVGLILLVWGDLQVEKQGALIFGIGAAVVYSAYILASSRLLQGVPALTASAYIQLSAGVVLAILHFKSADRVIDLISGYWYLFLAISLICSVFAMSLFLAGLQKLKNWEASILSTAEPVTAIFLAAIFLGEKLSAAQSMGAILVLGAFVMISLPKDLSQ